MVNLALSSIADTCYRMFLTMVRVAFIKSHFTWISLFSQSRNKSYMILRFLVDDRVDTDLVVSVTSEQGLSISRPSQANTLRQLGLLGFTLVFQGNVFNQLLGFKIPNLDARTSSSAQPVSVWREAKGIDDTVGIQRVQVLAIVEIPQHGDTVLTTSGAERTIRGNSDSVDVTSVTVVVGLQLALGQIPNLLKIIDE